MIITETKGKKLLLISFILDLFLHLTEERKLEAAGFMDVKHMSNSRHVGQMWPATAFYMAHTNFKNVFMY